MYSKSIKANRFADEKKPNKQLKAEINLKNVTTRNDVRNLISSFRSEITQTKMGTIPKQINPLEEV